MKTTQIIDVGKLLWYGKSFKAPEVDSVNVKGLQRWKQKQAQIEPLKAQMRGLMASIIAIDSQIRGDYHAIDKLRYENNQYLASEEFHIKVQERRGRYANLQP